MDGFQCPECLQWHRTRDNLKMHRGWHHPEYLEKELEQLEMVNLRMEAAYEYIMAEAERIRNLLPDEKPYAVEALVAVARDIRLGLDTPRRPRRLGDPPIEETKR